MRRYVSRHWSVRSHRSYIALSSSDTQLNSAAAAESECPRKARGSSEEIAREEEVTSERDDSSNSSSSSSTRKRRWFRHLRRRKKHGDGDTVVVVAQRTLPCEEFEVAVEASMNNYDVRPGMSHVVEHGSLSLLTAPRATTNGVELDIQALDLATTLNKSGFYQRAEEQQLTRPARRFAICEELEREMIMENGMNLRKSRKNLVIRQVLHDLLLL